MFVTYKSYNFRPEDDEQNKSLSDVQEEEDEADEGYSGEHAQLKVGRRRRKNSVSLPDLRDGGHLVASTSTPSSCSNTCSSDEGMPRYCVCYLLEINIVLFISLTVQSISMCKESEWVCNYAYGSFTHVLLSMQPYTLLTEYVLCFVNIITTIRGTLRLNQQLDCTCSYMSSRSLYYLFVSSIIESPRNTA